MPMEIRKGMKVRVKESLRASDNCHGVNDHMTALCGTVVTITSFDGNDNIRISEDNGDWVWTANCFESIEEEDSNMETPKTLMVKESDFELSEEKMEAWVSQATDLLRYYDYNTSEYGLKAVFKTWAKAKGWLVDLFRKHEYYNGNGQIVIPANLERPIDDSGIRTFLKWFNEQMNKWLIDRQLYIGLHKGGEYYDAYSRIGRIMVCMQDFDEYKKVTYKGRTYQEWEAEQRRMEKALDKMRSSYDGGTDSMYINDTFIFVKYLDLKEYRNIRDVMVQTLKNISDDNMKAISEERANNINFYLEQTSLKVRPVVGQKITKFVGKLLKELGFNKIVDIQKQEWYANGEYHSRDKDMGYNYHFALLGDSINPFTYKREVVISVNPFDYWTMSFGYGWASCHTIDKNNKRGIGSHNYQGCNSGGTESYMLDESSIIVYVRPSEENLASINELDMPLEEQSKMKRVVMYLGEDKLIQSRVYPDGRDGGDNGIAAQLRYIVQKVVAELYDTPNMWTLKKGSSEVCSVVNTIGDIHYPDYDCCSDVNVSYLRRIDGRLNYNTINVGVEEIICPDCGNTHWERDHITCNDCYVDGQRCKYCGNSFDIECDGYEIEGNYYCCYECAYEDGWRETEDDGWHDVDDCRQDDYSECWYYYTDDGIYIDDCWYHDEYNAECDGWRYADVDDDWYGEDNVYEDHDGNTFYMPEHEDEAIEIDGEWYLDAEDAERSGYIQNEDGEWVEAA